MPDPMDKIATLARLLKQRAAELGLDMQSFMPIVNLEDQEGKHFIQAMFVVEAPEEASTAIEALEGDEADLAGILAATAHAEEEALRNAAKQIEDDKITAARDRMLALRDRLSKGKGLLDEDEGEDE